MNNKTKKEKEIKGNKNISSKKTFVIVLCLVIITVLIFVVAAILSIKQKEVAIIASYYYFLKAFTASLVLWGCFGLYKLFNKSKKIFFVSLTGVLLIAALIIGTIIVANKENDNYDFDSEEYTYDKIYNGAVYNLEENIGFMKNYIINDENDTVSLNLIKRNIDSEKTTTICKNVIKSNYDMEDDYGIVDGKYLFSEYEAESKSEKEKILKTKEIDLDSCKITTIEDVDGYTIYDARTLPDKIIFTNRNEDTFLYYDKKEKKVDNIIDIEEDTYLLGFDSNNMYFMQEDYEEAKEVKIYQGYQELITLKLKDLYNSLENKEDYTYDDFVESYYDSGIVYLLSNEQYLYVYDYYNIYKIDIVNKKVTKTFSNNYDYIQSINGLGKDENYFFGDLNIITFDTNNDRMKKELEFDHDEELEDSISLNNIILFSTEKESDDDELYTESGNEEENNSIINVFYKKNRLLKRYKNIEKVWFDKNYLYLKPQKGKGDLIKIGLK